MTEFPAYWCEHPQLFASISEGKTAQDRMERVLKWFIATLKGQYTTRNEKMGSEKKVRCVKLLHLKLSLTCIENEEEIEEEEDDDDYDDDRS